jgi:ADP-heptose:LPS heptosyltransferase
VNILLIRLRLLGDVVFTTPAVRALRRRFPDAKLTYLVEPPAAPVVRSNPHLDAVIVSPRSRGLARVVEDASLAARLRAQRFDLVIDFHGGPRSSWLCAATGAPDRVGYTIAGRSWSYTRRIPRAPELRARHSVQCQWDLLSGFDPAFGQPDPATDAVEMPEEPAAAAVVAARLRAAGIDDQPLIVIHVSAGNPFRRWPVAAFVETIAELARADANRRILVTAGPSEESARHRVQHEARERLGPRRDAVPDAGEFDLPELRALLGRAALFIGGDTGPLHVAATTPVPIVGLYGPTLSARSRPWRHPALATEAVELADLACRPCDQRVCEPGDYRCLTTLHTGAVVEAAERALARSDTRYPSQSAVS